MNKVLHKCHFMKSQTMKKKFKSVMENLRDQKSLKKELINFALNYCMTIHIQ